jgi:hypothetical protein
MFILSINLRYFWIDNLIFYLLTKKSKKSSNLGVLLTKNGRNSLNSTKAGTMSLPKNFNFFCTLNHLIWNLQDICNYPNPNTQKIGSPNPDLNLYFFVCIWLNPFRELPVNTRRQTAGLSSLIKVLQKTQIKPVPEPIPIIINFFVCYSLK